MGFTYVIEHMEEDEPGQSHSLPEWVKLEYMHMRTVAGPKAEVLFTNVSESSAKELSTLIDSENKAQSITSSPNRSPSRLAKASATRTGVEKLMVQSSLPLDKVCLLDPKAELELTPADGDGRFNWFLFGGILGDDPPRDRTSELRKLGYPTRHLGSVQMTTDTAVAVTKRVVEDHIKLGDIPYIDFPCLSFGPKEGAEMPFRYIAVDGNVKGDPLMPPGMKELIRSDMDKSFDFAEGLSLDDIAESEKVAT
ncbi:DUF431-domain-containing protein [Schizopora paradoxa]|uniref:DUF431-domain-containing protein n=1 Tax=Schizopora paradoxa TaxID=27342 RepID=A0A0H2RAL4_9AGAM|nr:DUF431-domain-containing protein [Schizopora paradoxa]